MIILKFRYASTIWARVEEIQWSRYRKQSTTSFNWTKIFLSIWRMCRFASSHSMNFTLKNLNSIHWLARLIRSYSVWSISACGVWRCLEIFMNVSVIVVVVNVDSRSFDAHHSHDDVSDARNSVSRNKHRSAENSFRLNRCEDKNAFKGRTRKWKNSNENEMMWNGRDASEWTEEEVEKSFHFYPKIERERDFNRHENWQSRSREDVSTEHKMLLINSEKRRLHKLRSFRL